MKNVKLFEKLNWKQIQTTSVHVVIHENNVYHWDVLMSKKICNRLASINLTETGNTTTTRSLSRDAFENDELSTSYSAAKGRK